MTKAEKESAKTLASKDRDERDHELSRELDMTFPASDPPASTQPGSGITGPEVATASTLVR
jgi:hypothetical protein